MKHKVEVPYISPTEWYFERCPEAELPACLYYEYARSSPTMIKAIKNVHEDILSGVTEVPRLKDVAFLTDRFPAAPWLEILSFERRKMVGLIGNKLPPADLVYRRLETDFEDECFQESAFPEFGPVVRDLDDTTIALMQVHWDRGDTELKNAFKLFLKRYRPPKTKPRRGRIKRELDYLNSLGAKRLLDHCAHAGCKTVAKAALDLMKEQVNGSRETMRELFATASALSTAANKAEKYLLQLYGVPVDRRLPANNVMSEEENNLFGPVKPWFPGIYLDDLAGFG